MELPGRPQAEISNRTWQTTVALRPGACTIVDWTANATTEDKGAAEATANADHVSDEASESDGSMEDEIGGYASGTTALPPAIANDPFFAQLLKNAELRDAKDKKKAAKKRQSRKAKDIAEDNYDLDDPFIDDSELTFMDGHNHTQKQQRKKRRKKDDGNATETDGQDAVPAEPIGAISGVDEGHGVIAEDAAGGHDDDRLDELDMDDIDAYDEDDFFVYFGPLNEMVEGSAAEEEPFEEEPAGKKLRSRKRPEKKQQSLHLAKDSTQSRRRSNGASASKHDTTEAAAKKKTESKAQPQQPQPQPQQQQQHRRSGSTGSVEVSTAPPVAATDASLIPSNGRKAGPRTSRKLDQQPKASTVAAGTAETDGLPQPVRNWRPPVPARDKKVSELSAAASASAGSSKYPDATIADAGAAANFTNEESATQGYVRGSTPSAGGGGTAGSVAPEDTKAANEARLPTHEIEDALIELTQATKSEAFSNRQRFPSSLKPPLRQVCELSMARALEYDRSVLSLDTPEHHVFAWSTPLDIVGFTSGIYYRLADTLPYNRATMRKIVSKLMGADLITWKDRQLKQIEDGLKARIDEQIERGLGWIPVGARTASKDGDNGDAGIAQMRWHWTTISKHILYQYMILTLNINELRNHLEQSLGKDGSYREQQARKDAYAHLVNLWPGSGMSTYEISRAYSSRKSLLEKQTKKSDPTMGQPRTEASTIGVVASDPTESLPKSADSAAYLSSQVHSHVTPDPPKASSPYDNNPVAFLKQASPYFQQTSPMPVTSPAREPYVCHQSSPFDDGVLLQPHLSQVPMRRNLGFSNPLVESTLDQQVRSHVSSYYASDSEQQQQQQQQQQGPDANEGEDNNSQSSSRYSMSVKNLMSP
ncbi:hypothetical protein BX661DRAFT_175857 [Kickxella alabastrina]|uniref:uncharacterized protein n=1 Tax=Kickxella alabastrina TaxID=61397 RepID=UPI00221E8CE8|nr:uncharacterized protein BX661DRAFT_175857 [Kickxella alabastrina]KAI7834969.1 hypothetical protein BX661DRAFT_175857 [Kickxella alabastrina]